MVTLSPPTSEIGVQLLAQPQVEKLVVACRWSAVYSAEPCYHDGFFINEPQISYLCVHLFGVLRRFQHCTRRVVGRAEETSTYSSLGFCTVNCRPTASNYQLSHLRSCWGSNLGLRGGRRECYHSATVAPL